MASTGSRCSTCVDAGRHDPSAGRLRRLQQAFAKDALQLGLQIKVRDAAVDGDDELGHLQLPVALQQLEHQLWRRVVRQAHVLQRRQKRGDITCVKWIFKG